MPEGDSVWLARRRLHDALADTTVTRFELRVPRFATTDLSGQRFLDVASRGKHLLIRFDSGLTLRTHFRLDGEWRLGRTGERWRGWPTHDVRAVLGNSEWEAVGYRLHDIELLPTREEHRLIGHLGPDILGDDWNLTEAVRRLTSLPMRTIGPALLDQRNIAGIGNLYKTESLYVHRITPWTLVGDVNAPADLLQTAKRLMWANREHPEQSTTGSRLRSESRWVFERAGRPCLRCASRVRVANQTDTHPVGETNYPRLSYWCAHCQKGPAPY